MIKVLLVIHLIVTLVMIGLILLQRSEGGGLGIGGGSGGMGAFASPRATANALSKVTMVCFGLFVGLSLVLAILSGHKLAAPGLLDQLNQTPAGAIAPAVPGDATAPTAPVQGGSEQPQVPMPE